MIYDMDFLLYDLRHRNILHLANNPVSSVRPWTMAPGEFSVPSAERPYDPVLWVRFHLMLRNGKRAGIVASSRHERSEHLR